MLVGLLSLGNGLLMWDPERPFREQQLALLAHLTKGPPRTLVFQGPGEPVAVTDPEEVESFVSLLIGADHVHYHHSHPVGELSVSFEGRSEKYTLGPDSQNQDEYWFDLVPGPNTELVWGPTIKLLRSPDMTDWLTRNGVFP
jgi:hypothetical protein